MRRGRYIKRIALYHAQPGRHYKRTKAEMDNNTLHCPKCKRHGELVDMERRTFTKSNKIWVCPECDWKITEDKVI